ncbi:MAG: HAD-IB family hydrolase, partial [Mycobacterium sp.]
GLSYFYADGDEDAALMKLVGHPRPVNPRAGLAALAAEQGWPVLRLTAPGQRRPADALGHLPAFSRAALGAAFSAVALRGRRR